jgi:hypothetical protein
MKGKRDVYYNSGKARNLRVGKNVLNDFAIMTENLFVLVGQCRSRSDNFLSATHPPPPNVFPPVRLYVGVVKNIYSWQELRKCLRW